MRTCIRKIGNSRGILIPPAFLAVCGIGDHVDILMEGKSLLRRPVQEPRAGWFEGFNRLTEVIRHPNGRNGRKTDCRINHTDSHFLADITRPQVGARRSAAYVSFGVAQAQGMPVGTPG